MSCTGSESGPAQTPQSLALALARELALALTGTGTKATVSLTLTQRSQPSAYVTGLSLLGRQRRHWIHPTIYLGPARPARQPAMSLVPVREEMTAFVLHGNVTAVA